MRRGIPERFRGDAILWQNGLGMPRLQTKTGASARELEKLTGVAFYGRILELMGWWEYLCVVKLSKNGEIKDLQTVFEEKINKQLCSLQSVALQIMYKMAAWLNSKYKTITIFVVFTHSLLKRYPESRGFLPYIILRECAYIAISLNFPGDHSKKIPRKS